MAELLDKYSPAQKEAITLFGREISVSAGAGSGKTSVLVERFLYAVTQRKVDAERILAITFTEKAAAEMKSRLVEECRERNLGDLRRKLESAYIGTIHGFCSRILKENPIESGVDPAFQVLSDGEAQILMDQVIERIFEEGGENERLLEMLGQFGEEPLIHAVKKFYDMGRAMGDDTGIFKLRNLSSVQKKIISQLLSGAKALDELIDPVKATESELKLKTGACRIMELIRSPESAGWDMIERIEEARGQLHRRIPRYKEAVENCLELLEDWRALVVEKLGEPFKNEFEKVCVKFKTLYDEEKRVRASYDFEDLLLVTTRLLSGTSPEKKAVRTRYRKYFSCILVDEYQDTSPLQDKIIELLKQEDNLFVVGDAQQSIYGFRFADPEIFHRRILAYTNAKNGSRLRLSQNYRSRSQILQFINAFFKQISDGNSFHPLEACRPLSSDAMPFIEVLCVPRGEKEEGESLDQARVIEARSLAAHIRKLVDAGTPIYPKGSHSRPIRYKDIAVLFRGLTTSTLYEKELNDQSIPYVITKGGGFYEKPEILDFINCLKLIENPHLDIALAGVLRSPLVALSDDALFWLARSAKSNNHEAPLFGAFASLNVIKEISSEDRVKLLRFLKLLEELRQQKEALTISGLLEKILKETFYEAKALTRVDGRQMVANILKLISIAESVEEKNIAGVQDFIRLVKHFSDSDTPEAEARLDSGLENAVMLSTIHAAKGLEFPIVIVADMGRERYEAKQEAFVFSPETGFGIKLRQPKTQKFLKDYTFGEIDKALGEKESREEERLMYVAFTRAEEHLILSGVLDVDRKTGSFKKKASWMSQAAEVLALDPFASTSEYSLFEGVKVGKISLEKKSIKIKADKWSWARDPVAGGALKDLRPLTEKEKAVLPTATGKPIADFESRFRPVTKNYEETRDRTVSDLLLAVRKGWQESGADNEEFGTPRNEYGTIFHRLMEYGMSRRSKKMATALIPPALISGLSVPEQQEIKGDILQFWAGSWGKQARESTACYAELPFIYKTRYGILKGQIDLVMKTKSDEWIILDYKTNRLLPQEKEALAKEYEIQLLLYAFVFKKLYGEAPKRGVLYFSNIRESFEFSYAGGSLDGFEGELENYFKMSQGNLESS